MVQSGQLPIVKAIVAEMRAFRVNAGRNRTEGSGRVGVGGVQATGRARSAAIDNGRLGDEDLPDGAPGLACPGGRPGAQAPPCRYHGHRPRPGRQAEALGPPGGHCDVTGWIASIRVR